MMFSTYSFTNIMQPPKRRKTVRQDSTDGLSKDEDTIPLAGNKQSTEMSDIDVIATSSKKKSIQCSQSQDVKEVEK